MKYTALTLLTLVLSGLLSSHAQPLPPNQEPVNRSLHPAPNPVPHGAPLKLADSPLAFEPNVGQFDGDLEFLARGNGASILLAHGRAEFALENNSSNDGSPGAEILWLKPGRANETDGQAENPLPAHANYFQGNQARLWRRDVATCSKVR